MRDFTTHFIQFRHNADATHALYINEDPTGLRIYPVQEGDEPVKLGAGGRIISALLWCAEGGPYKQKKRVYDSEEDALDTEIERFYRWYDRTQERLAEKLSDEDGEECEYAPISLTPCFKTIGVGRHAVFLRKNDDEESGVDTGFIIDYRSDGTQGQSNSTPCRISYDGHLWYTVAWPELNTTIGHIMLYIDSLLVQGPQALKEFTARYAWRQSKDGTHRLFDDGENTGIAVRSGIGGFLCYYLDGAAPQEILPTLRAAQIEAELHYIRDRLEENDEE